MVKKVLCLIEKMQKNLMRMTWRPMGHIPGMKKKFNAEGAEDAEFRRYAIGWVNILTITK